MENTIPFKIIDVSQEIISYIRCQNYHEASLKIKILSEKIKALPETIFNPGDDYDSLLTCLNAMSNALEVGDMILYADILEDSFIPFIKSQITPAESINIDNYTLEPTSSGAMTLYYNVGKIYLHSNCNPMDEARQMINLYYEEKYSEYVVFGLGLGYHIDALYKASLGTLRIKVFEPHTELIEYVKANDNFGLFSNDRIQIYNDPTCADFCRCLSDENTGILFHYPSLLKIADSEQRASLRRFYISWNSYYQLKRRLIINFNNNIKNCPHNISEIRDNFFQKKTYIIAAGPSLDRNLKYLKTQAEKTDTLIVCVSTVLKKLMEHGIKADYVIVMDAQERTYKHIEGIEECDIPMIIDSTAYWRFASDYSGRKLLALQKGYPPAEDYANAHSFPLFNTGGSVTTLAIDIALQFGAQELYLAGVDMAYPGGKTHAQGTIDEGGIEKENLIKIKDVNGGTVYTSEQLYSYLSWIENRLSQSSNVKVYNLSDCGAMIKGTHNFTS